MPKIAILIALLCFTLFTPIISMYLNFSGYSELNTDTYVKITSKDFNLLTFGGLGTALSLFLELGKYSISGLPVIFNIFFVFMFLLTLIVLFFFVRGV